MMGILMSSSTGFSDSWRYYALSNGLCLETSSL